MKNKFFITIFILSAFIFLAFAGWFYVFSKINSEKKEIFELRKIILRNDKKNNNEKSLSRLIDGIKKEKNIIDSFFLKEKDLIRLINGLESIGENASVSLKISSVSVEKKAGSKPGLLFSVKGTFDQLFKYLYFLENLPYLITVDSVSFQKTGDGNENTQENAKENKSTHLWQALFSIKLESYEN